MRTRRESAVPTELSVIAERVTRWRRDRTRFSPMPEELWREAATLARRLGVSPVARVLGLGHNALKQRTMNAPGSSAAPVPGGFVELKGVEVVDVARAATSTAVVELSGRDGTMLRVRLPASAALDVAMVASVLWKARA